jgi:hypothetical protein
MFITPDEAWEVILEQLEDEDIDFLIVPVKTIRVNYSKDNAVLLKPTDRLHFSTKTLSGEIILTIETVMETSH